jgi:hypothetical protein
MPRVDVTSAFFVAGGTAEERSVSANPKISGLMTIPSAAMMSLDENMTQNRFGCQFGRGENPRPGASLKFGQDRNINMIMFHFVGVRSRRRADRRIF